MKSTSCDLDSKVIVLEKDFGMRYKRRSKCISIDTRVWCQL